MQCASKHVLQILEATEGGTRRHLRDLTLGLLARGWRVTLAVSCNRDPDFEKTDIPLLRSAGADVRIVSMARGIAPFRDFSAFRNLLAIMREAHPDIVHAHSSKAGFLGRFAAHFAHIPAIYTPHGFAFEMDVKTARRFFYRQLERLAARWTTEIIAVSNSEALSALTLSPTNRGLSPSKIGVCPHRKSGSVPVSVVYNGIDADALDGKMQVSAPQYDAVFIGRICRQKAPEIFLTACELILKKRRAAKFAIMTAWNPAKATISIPESLRDSIKILPGGGKDATARLLHSARLLAMPSRWEGFPYLILEAMAAGTPIVASDIGGVGEAARNGREALLVPPNNPKALSDAMWEILSDPSLAARLATNGQSRAKAFAIDEMIDGIAAAYERNCHGFLLELDNFPALPIPQSLMVQTHIASMPPIQTWSQT